MTCLYTEFPSSVKLYNHNYDVHLNMLQVTTNKKTSVVERIDGRFNCPDCCSRLSTCRLFNNRLEEKHKGTCSTLSTAEKRRDSETDDDESTPSVFMKHHKPSKGENDFSTDNSVTFLTSTQFDDDTAVLLACNSLSSSPHIQDNCVLATKIGKSTNADDLLKHLTSTSPIYRHIAHQQYVELSKQITQEINKDWAFFPQLRFATSQMFAGSILLSGSTALLINCVESYGRLKTVDSHHERRTYWLRTNLRSQKQNQKMDR